MFIAISHFHYAMNPAQYNPIPSLLIGPKPFIRGYLPPNTVRWEGGKFEIFQFYINYW